MINKGILISKQMSQENQYLDIVVPRLKEFSTQIKNSILLLELNEEIRKKYTEKVKILIYAFDIMLDMRTFFDRSKIKSYISKGDLLSFKTILLCIQNHSEELICLHNKSEKLNICVSNYRKPYDIVLSLNEILDQLANLCPDTYVLDI